MTQQKEDSITTLRKRAETLLTGLPTHKNKFSREEFNQVLHELQVHQIELELQNEELRQTQTKLEENRARYMMLYHNAPVGYVVLNQAGIITESNATFAKMVEVDNPQINGKPFADFLVSDYQTIFRARLKSFFKQPVDKHIELQLKSTDNVPRYVDFAATRQNRQEISEDFDDEMLITVTDVTVRVEAEKSLQKAKDFTAAIIDSLDSHICVLDEYGIILMVNKSWKHFAAENSLSTTDYLGVGVNYLSTCENVHGEDGEAASRFSNEINAILKGERERFTLEYPCHSPDEERWFIVTATKLISDITYGKVVVAHQNITKRKQLEKEQRYLQDQLSQIAKAESLGVMAGAIAHNFNNILGAVIGNLELALELPHTGGNQTSNVKNALSAAWRASEMSRLMLTYLGQTRSERQLEDFSTICDQNLEHLNLAKPSAIVITTDFPYPGPCVRVNKKQIQQIVLSLVTNSWEAIDDEPGNIHLSISTVRSSAIPDKFRFPLNLQLQHQSYACLIVRDDGHGIADDDIEKIFDPFFTNKFTGRGMGLSAMLGILRSHEGVVTVESQLTKGTVFRVYIPICAP